MYTDNTLFQKHGDFCFLAVEYFYDLWSDKRRVFNKNLNADVTKMKQEFLIGLYPLFRFLFWNVCKLVRI